MIKIRPAIFIGIGPQSRRTVQGYERLVQIRHGSLRALLPVIVDYAADGAPGRREGDNVQQIVLSPPVFDAQGDWPSWLPAELANLPAGQRDRARAWMRAALLQEAEAVQDFFLERVPHLSSFAAAEELDTRGMDLVGSSEVDVYLVADLGDPLGSGIAVDMADLIASVCRQLGWTPLLCGVLYLPSAISPAPVEEALAYAALKELEHEARGHPYVGDMAETEVAHETSLFDNGCYLIDSVNEAGYTLENETQQVEIVGEWLYAMTFLGMAAAIQARWRRRYQSSTLRGKARVFASLGMTLRYVPCELLEEWGAARLGKELVERVVDGRAEADPDKLLWAFVERVGLRADVLEGMIRQKNDAARVEEMMSPLYGARLGRIAYRARQVLTAIREEYLPVLDRGVRDSSAQMQHEIRQEIDQEVREILDTSFVGGIGLATRFLGMLDDHIISLLDGVQRQSRQHELDLGRSMTTLSDSYYALRSAQMSVPPWPVTFLALIALLIVPLIYGGQLVWRSVLPAGAVWAALTIGILAVGVLIVLAWAAFQLARQRGHVILAHIRQVRQRFELESRPIVLRAVQEICGAAREAVEQARHDLGPLAERLRTAAEHFGERAAGQAQALNLAAQPGPMRSAVDLGRAERFYRHAVPDPALLSGDLARQAGGVSEWQERARQAERPLLDYLEEQLLRFGAQHIQRQLPSYGTLGALTLDANPVEVRGSLERLFEEAHPLWNYDPARLRRAKTQRIALIGADVDSKAWSGVVEHLAKVQPRVIPVPTQDPQRLVVLNVHHGVPLFALRRIGEYRVHYAEMLWHSRLPLHRARDLALVEDLLPVRRRPRFVTATLFAAGVALGILGRDPDGRYVAPRSRGRSLRLSAQKERAVGLMGLDAPACRETQRQLDAILEARGQGWLRDALDEYLADAPGLEDWEVKGILDLGQVYGLVEEE